MTPELATVEIVIVEKTNVFRRQNKLTKLKRNAVLDRAARAFARYLAQTGKFSHTADGRRPADRVKLAGYKFCLVAENLALNGNARGFTASELADQAMAGWRDSPGHRRNMLLPAVTDIGVGVAKAAGEHRYLSVQLFGRPEALRYRFSIRNEARKQVRYTFAGKPAQLPPRSIMTHTACLSANAQFSGVRARGVAAGTDPSFPVKDGDQFVIRQHNGTLHLTHRPRVER